MKKRIADKNRLSVRMSVSAWFEKGISDPLNRLARLAEQVCFLRTRCNIDRYTGRELVGER